jgi:hypothetical protein
MFARYVLALTLALASIAALAQQPYVDIEQRLNAGQLRDTGLATLSPAQLELLNQLLRDDVAKAVEAGQAAAREGSETGRGAASLIGFNDEPIRSRLQGPVDGWEPGTEFVLQNGQTWKVLKGSMKLRGTLNSPEILVVPGIAGRWFLQVDEDLPKARVYRID